MPIESTHPEYDSRLPQWSRCRHTVNGTDPVKGAGETYLPKLGTQSPSDYDAYKKRALFYGASNRTVQGLVGAIMRKEPVIELPASIDYQDDITGTGVSLQEFSKSVSRELLVISRLGIFIDRDEKGSNPTLALYQGESITNWEYDGNRLVMVVLKESVLKKRENDGYEWEAVTQYRELIFIDGVYTVNLWQKAGDKGFEIIKTLIPSKMGNKLTEIPFVFVNPHGTTSKIEKPVILDLVDVNLSHYRSSADLEHGRHFTALPTPWIAGSIAGGRDSVDQKLEIGSTTAWMLESGGQAGFLEFTGQGLQSLEAALSQKEAMMAILGAKILADQKNVAETAEKARIDANGEGSALTSISTSASMAIKQALEIMAEWVGGTGEVVFELNKDFLPTTIDAQTLTAMMQSVQAGLMSHETYYENLQRGELARPDRSIEDEKELIDNAPIIPVAPSFE